ncbi:hypothetical protein [Neomoorella mulderi]|uniref:hypothetical protein n=1 Tax=Neomoorella mulderi TaxID=202604 RepID=UPI0007839B05|nr:hypothetical protein [Moorella mulderi]
MQYQEMVETAISWRQCRGYRQAAEFLRRMKGLYERHGAATILNMKMIITRKNFLLDGEASRKMKLKQSQPNWRVKNI